MVAEGDLFSNLDSTQAMDDSRRELARKRGIHRGPLTDFKPFLTRKGQERLSDYQRMVPERIGARGSCICDLGQGLRKRARIRPWLPTSTKSSRFASLTKGGRYVEHIFTPDELAFAHGWPSLKFDSNADFQDAMPSELGRLGQVQRQKVLGNGVHLCMLYAWNLYIESHVIRRSQLSGYVPRSIFQDRSDEDVSGQGSEAE